jgi:hypothetical protein
VPPVGRSAASRQNDTNNNILHGTRPIHEHADTLMKVSDDDLRIRVGRIRNRGTRIRPKSFVGQALKAAHKAGYVGRRSAPSRRRLRPSTRGRARGTAAARARLFDPSRRVVVKARVVRHRSRTFRAAPLATHVAI